MQKRKCHVSNRAWNFLRLALLWARKGGLLKRRFTVELRLLPKFMRSLGHATPRGQLYYGEQELSFDKTPVVHVKMHRPASLRFHIPCINPPVDFDYDFDNVDDDNMIHGYNGGRKSLIKGREEDEEEDGDVHGGCEEEENGIDLRAEEFIARFYEQMKLQRQISLLQYTETPKKGTLCST